MIKPILVIIIISLIFLCANFFRYEHENRACGNGCAYVWDRWHQKECLSFFEKGIACSQEEIDVLFTSPDELAKWNNFVAANQPKHSSILTLNVILTFAALGFLIIIRKSIGRFFKKLCYSSAIKYYTLGIGAFMGSLIASGIPGVLGYMATSWPLCWLMSLFRRKSK